MYPKYEIPSTAGIKWASGVAALQDLPEKYLCSQADAQVILKAFIDAGVPATLENIALDPAFAFQGLAASNTDQPWFIKSAPVTGPAGFAVAAMYAPNRINGGGIGNPGSWHGIGTSPQWVAVAPPPPPPPPPYDNSGDAATFFGAQGGGYAPADRNRDDEVYRLVHAIAHSLNIQ